MKDEILGVALGVLVVGAGIAMIFACITLCIPAPPRKELCARSIDAYVVCLDNPRLDCDKPREAVKEFCGL